MVASWLGDATPERGGRAKKLFRVEPAGEEALRQSRGMLDAMWEAAGLAPRTP